MISLEEMRADIARLVHMAADEIEMEDNLYDLGLDSMRVMQLLLDWEGRGLRADFSRFAEEATLAGWWAIVSEGL